MSEDDFGSFLGEEQVPADDSSREVPDIMTAQQVASLLAIDRHEVYVLARKGELPGVVRHRGRIYFVTRELLRRLSRSRP